MDRIEDDATYKQLTAQGVPQEGAWATVWIDRAYQQLVNDGMQAEAAYAQVVSSLLANSIDVDSLSPEAFIKEVMGAGSTARREFPKLDPAHPEASQVAQYNSSGQGGPFQSERSKVA